MNTPTTSRMSSPMPSTEQSVTSCILDEIEIQLLNEVEDVRFQCLAYWHNENTPYHPRCRESCRDFGDRFPRLFGQAINILKGKDAMISVEDFRIIIRTLFCNMHYVKGTFIKHLISLKLDWKGDGNAKEARLLEIFRQVHGLPTLAILEQDFDISRCSSSRASTPFDWQSGAEDMDLPLQLYQQGSPSPARSAASGGSGQQEQIIPRSLPRLATEMPFRTKLLTPPGTVRHMRCRSNPPQRNVAFHLPAKPVIQTANGSTQKEQRPRGLSFDARPPSNSIFNFSISTPQSHATASSPCLLASETPRPSQPGPPLDGTNYAVVEGSPNTAPAISDILRSGRSTSGATLFVPQDQTSNDVAFAVPKRQISSNRSISTSFIPSEWANVRDWNDCFNPFPAVHSHFQPTVMPRRSRDDTFLQQVSDSAAAAAPPLFDTDSVGNIPIPEAAGNTTGKNDGMFFPAIIDTWIRKAIMKSTTKEGFVYILKAPEYFRRNFPGEPPLVKIGMAVDVKKRVEELRKCGLFDLTIVDDGEDKATHLYWKIEELVHTELRNSQRVLKCKQCKTTRGSETEHHEWFAVSEEVALATVQRWRNFIVQNPYDDNGILKGHWSNMLHVGNMEHPAKEEKWSDYQSRDKRWTKWLQNGIASTPKGQGGANSGSNGQ